MTSLKGCSSFMPGACRGPSLEAAVDATLPRFGGIDLGGNDASGVDDVVFAGPEASVLGHRRRYPSVDLKPDLFLSQ